MRWLRFEHEEREQFGSLEDDDRTIRVWTGSPWDPGTPTGATLTLDSVRPLTPVRPGKFLALWNNFHELAARLNQAIPQEPLFFVKTPNSYLAPGAAIRIPAAYTGKVLYEGELGVVIGRRCRDVDEARAAECILGYTCVNDVTAIDVLNKDASFAQWTRAKSFDTFGPFGPVIATGLDWSALRVRTLLNGRERQSYPAADMILPPPRIISLLSREMTLEPGDLIACGTSVGVLPMRAGMRVDVVIDGIGTLTNTVELPSENPAP